jgi:adenylate cyclase
MTVHSDIAAIGDWVIEQGVLRPDFGTLLEEYCQRLVAAGLPIWHAYFASLTLHPTVATIGFLWHRDSGVIRRTYTHEDARLGGWKKYPLYFMFKNRISILRRRLEGSDAVLDFPQLEDLKSQGATDYVGQLTEFGLDGAPDRETGFLVSWSTDRSNGFTDADIAALEYLQPRLALALQSRISYEIEVNLLNTYVGPDAGRRILAGEIERGKGKRIRAAILLSDLRDFTAMSDRLPADEVIALLNDYFDIMATQVQEHGGEVLKFIGDGMLAVFNVGRSLPDAACGQAMHAAIAAVRALTALNLDRAEKLEVGIALHLGDVVYGNIGAADRLDFTVIGAAVNEAARIQGLCRSLDKQILVSAGFACGCTSKPLISLGRHHLRGVSEAKELFTIDALSL